MSLASALANIYISHWKYTPNRQTEFWLARLLDRVFKSFQVSTHYGIRLNIFLSSGMDMSYCEPQATNPHHKTVEILNQLEEGDLFLDVGANIGFFGLIAAKKVGKTGLVVCFEPSAREFVRLIENIELNGAKNTIFFNTALCDRVGVSRFLTAKSHTGLNFLAETNSDANFVESLVPTIKGDLVLEPFLAQIDGKVIVKIDVEGAEYQVICGMQQFLSHPKVKSVVVEITPKFLARFDRTKEMLYEKMQMLGFEPTVMSDEWQYDEIFKR
jgi:FkbM family methyltransferase